jgi:alpha-tubulin suppressor-like RCC1 family protein
VRFTATPSADAGVDAVRDAARAAEPDTWGSDTFAPDLDAFTPDAFTPDAFAPDAFAPDAPTGPNRVVQISLEENAFGGMASFSCALHSDGRVACWGRNTYGQLGDGSTTDRTMPVEVLDIHDAISISAGSEHACALRRTGELWCWGRNQAGQLGDGTLTDSSRPVRASLGAEGIRQFDVGLDRSCVVRLSGAVDCWGSTIWASLSTNALTPERVWAGGVDRVELTSAQIFAFRGTSAEYVGAFGLAGGAYPPVTVPTAFPGAPSLEGISHGWDTTCATLVSGSVICGGRDQALCGDGDVDGPYENAPPTSVSVMNAIETASGGGHNCALTSGGSVYCWGWWDYVLGNGPGATNVATPTLVGGISTATQIEAGWAHTCVLLRDGRVQCWGANEAGQLGTGDLATRFEPTTVVGLPLP